MKKILFVCTGNTCRSPMAEALFKDILADREDKEEFSVSSAGIYAFEGDPASPEAVEVMKNEFGIDISKHRAKVLNDIDIADAFIILTMTERHRKMIIDIYPHAGERVFTLKQYAEAEDGNPNISDPFGWDIDVYKDCASEIDALLLDVVDKI